MYVFGINLPVAEILLVMTILFFIGLIIVIVQLRSMGRHIRVLDETTLEIRRYEEDEELLLRHVDATTQKYAQKDVEKFHTTVNTTEKKIQKALLAGTEPSMLKSLLVAEGLDEQMATRIVNNAAYVVEWYLDRDVSDLEKRLRKINRTTRI